MQMAHVVRSVIVSDAVALLFRHASGCSVTYLSEETQFLSSVTCKLHLYIRRRKRNLPSPSVWEVITPQLQEIVGLRQGLLRPPPKVMGGYVFAGVAQGSLNQIFQIAVISEWLRSVQ